MATSGNTSWELTRNQIIEAAMRKIGALAKGQSADSDDINNASMALNSLMALFETDGMPLWKRTTLPITLVASTNTYNLLNAVKLAQLNILYTGGATKYPLMPKSLYDFNRLPPTSGGIPNSYYFQPKIQDGTLVIWPTPTATEVVSYSLEAVVQKEYDGFFASGETPDFPPYWTDALIYGLAVRLAPETGLPIQDRQLLIKEAQMYFDMASDYGDEDGSFMFQPDKMAR